MAEVLEAILQLQIDSFTASLQQAAQQVTAFAQAIQGSVGSAGQVFTQQVQQINNVAAAIRTTSQATQAATKDTADLTNEINKYVRLQEKEWKASQQEFARNEREKVAIAKRVNQERAASKKELLDYTTSLQKQFLQTAIGLGKERQAAEQATLAFIAESQKLFFATTQGMEKERLAAAQRTTTALAQLQKDFFNTAVGLGKERVIEERRAASEILAIWTRMQGERNALQAQAQQRIRMQQEVGNLQADANIRNILGQGRSAQGIMFMDPAVQQQLIMYGLLAQEAAKYTSFWDSAITRVGTSLKTLGGYFAASFIIGIPFAIAAWAKEAVGAAVKMEALTASFKGITGSAAGAANALAFLRGVANRMGFDFVETANQFKNLEAAAHGTKLEGEKVRVLFEQVAMAQRVMGLSGEQASRGFLAIEQMVSKGTITMEELRKQLSQAIPGSVGIMARALGIGTDELTKMMKAGSLLAEDVLPRFGRQLEKELGPGLRAATETAQATFARFGNNLRDVSVAVGTYILSMLKPVMDTINRGFELYNKAKAAAAEARDEGLGTRREQLSPIEGAGLQKEIDEGRLALERAQKTLQVLNQRATALLEFRRPTQAMIDEQKELVAFLQKSYDEILKKRERFIDAQQMDGTPEGGGGEIPFAKQMKAVKEETEKATEALAALAIQRKNTPALFAGKGELEEAREGMRKAEEGINKLTAAMATAKAAQQGDVIPQFKKELDAQNAIYAAARAKVTALEEAAAAEKKADSDAEARRNALRAKELARQADAKRLTEDALKDIAKITEGETESKLVALETRLQAMRDAQVEETLIAKLGATERVRIYAEEYEKATKVDQGALAAIKRRRTDAEATEAIITRFSVQATKTRVDDHDAEVAKAIENMQGRIDAGESFEDDMTALVATGAARRTRIQEEEHAKLAKEAEKPWREFGNTLEDTLQGVFQNILSGSKSLWEGLRDGFLKLLIKLAADAITHTIIIPAMVGFMGGGSGGGGGGFGGAMAAIGGIGGAGAGGAGGGGGGDMINMALGLASAGNSVSGALGGPSLSMGSVTGGFGGMGGISAIMGTELGFLPGIGTSLGGVGSGGAVGAPATALGATSISTVISGIGAGIAVGMILKQINNMLGIGGMGGSVLAGAGGGALAGTMILPGIGTAVGTVVGAIGGLIAGLLQKDPKPQAFDIHSVQPGQISYDDILGMQVTQNFQILKDFHQRLGTDYEDFIKVIDDGVNDMFDQVVAQVGNASPEVQRALVGPLNDALSRVASAMVVYPEISGGNFGERIEQMMNDFGKYFEVEGGAAIQELLDAVETIDPIVKAFQRIIDSLLEDIRQLEQQQKAMNDALNANFTTLHETLQSPAEILGKRTTEYNALLAQFEGGDEVTRIALAPRIGELATAILELSKTVLAQSFGDITGIETAIVTMQEALFTPAQTMAARQADLIRLMGEFRGGTDSVRTVLTPQITNLALQIMELAKGVTTLAEQQALLADFPVQMRAITEALFTPAQSYLSERQQLTEMMALFRAGSPEQQRTLEPQIAQLAAQIMGRARGEDVLGQDPQLLRQTQSELVDIMHEVQNTIAAQVGSQGSDAAQLQATLERTQAEMLVVLREVQYGMAGTIVNAGAQTIQALHSTAGQIISTNYTVGNGIITAEYQTANGVVVAQYSAAGQLMNTQHYIGGVLAGSINNTSNTVAGWSSALYQVQAQLIGQVASVRDAVYNTYNQLIHALWTEIGLAQQEIQLLVGSLNNLSTLNAAVARALGVLGEMNTRLGNPLNVAQGESISTHLQREAINVAQASLHAQRQGGAAMIAVASKAAYGLDFVTGFSFGRQVIGFQHGGLVPRNMTAFLHAGERVIPEWQNRGGRGGGAMTINVYGGGQDASRIADMVIQKIETKAGRLQSSTIQVAKR